MDAGGRSVEPGTEEAVRAYVALAREVGLSPAQLALAFVTSRSFVTANIIGATTLAQLEENLGSLDVTITPEIEDRIDALYQLHGSPAP